MSKLILAAISPGSSVQDNGRYGAQRYGLVPSGAVDRLAMAAANALLGNPLFAATIELGPLNSVLTAKGGAVRVAVTGALRPIDVAGQPVALNTTVTLADGESLNLGVARSGTFGYLALEGGVRGEPMFGSLAVNGRAGLGSPYPRPLQAGDELQVAGASAMAEKRIELPPPATGPIRVVMGPQDDEFAEGRDLFLNSDWKISATSDRMGYRLEGPAIRHLHGHNIVSDGTVNGSVQVPGNGQPIVLMPDRGTSGGYPKIATVITADLGRFGQTQPGMAFRFKAVTMREAQEAYRGFAEFVAGLPGRVHDSNILMLDIKALLQANVAGTAIDATNDATWQAAIADH